MSAFVPYAAAMEPDRTIAIVEDIIEALAHGAVAGSADALSIERRDDGSVLEVDLGEPDRVYIVSVTSVERVD
jgi:hypothetical protein